MKPATIMATVSFCLVMSASANGQQLLIRPDFANNRANIPTPKSANPMAESALPAKSLDWNLKFVRKKWHRIFGVSAFGLPEQVRVEAAVKLTDSEGVPIADKLVTLTVLSITVPPSATATTDSDGKANFQVDFDLPTASLKVELEAYLANNKGISDKDSLSLRDWVDFDLGLDLGYTGSGLPSVAGSNSPLKLDSTFSVIATARLQFNLWEMQRINKYYRFAVYGSVPAVFLGRAVSGEGNFILVDNVQGVGDISAGVNLSLAGVLFDVSYNGRTGKLSVADSIRNLGSPSFVNLGDGFESIDSSIQSNKSLGRRSFLFGTASYSHPFKRRTFTNGDSATRGDFYQGIAGIGLAGKERRAAALFWGGYSKYEEIRLRSSQGKVTIPFPNRHEWLAGITGVGLTKRRVNVSGGLVVGGIDSERLYVSVNLRFNFNIF